MFRVKEGFLIFEAELAGTDEIKYWIMTWGANAQVLEPTSLQEEIRREAMGMLGGYGPPVVSEDSSG